MRVIGGHDYYDTAGWSIDPTCVFQRNKEQDNHTSANPITLPKPIWSYDHPVALVPGLAMVGNLIFPFWEKRTPAEGWNPSSYEMASGQKWTRVDTEFFYSEEAVLKEMEKFPSKYSKQRRATWTNRIKKHFEFAFKPEQMDWLINEKVTTMVARHWRYGETGDSKVWLEVNTPELKDIKLYTVLDPATAHMTVSSWISGVLPSSKNVVELKNKDRIVKAGFDTKTSFRKPPQNV